VDRTTRSEFIPWIRSQTHSKHAYGIQKTTEKRASESNGVEDTKACMVPRDPRDIGGIERDRAQGVNGAVELNDTRTCARTSIDQQA
jgi:hypothetical protein